MKSTVFSVSHFLTLLLIAFCTTTGYTQETFKSIVAKSNFIFAGTIMRMNASNIEVKPASPTAIVRVDEVIDAVPPYDEMKGKEITVLLAPGENLKEGNRQVFYTIGWYYGKALGVKEVPNNLQKTLQDTLKRSVTQQRVQIHLDSIRSELGKSSLVIQGTVIDNNVKTDRPLSFESEHDPEFRKAIISIQAVIKGAIKTKQVTVVYSASEDVIWHNSPKLEKGQQAIFLLQTNQAPTIYHLNGYTVLDKRDVQPISSLHDIKALLKR